MKREAWWSAIEIGSRFWAAGLRPACLRKATAIAPYCSEEIPCSCIWRRPTWAMNGIAPTSP